MNQKVLKIVGLMIGIAEWNHKRRDRFLVLGETRYVVGIRCFRSALYYTLAPVGCEVVFYDIYPIDPQLAEGTY